MSVSLLILIIGIFLFIQWKIVWYFAEKSTIERILMHLAPGPTGKKKDQIKAVLWAVWSSRMKDDGQVEKIAKKFDIDW